MSSTQTTENVGRIVHDVDINKDKNKNFDSSLSKNQDMPVLNENRDLNWQQDKDWQQNKDLQQNKDWQQNKDLNYDKTTHEPSLVTNVVEAAKTAGLKVRDAAAGAAQKVKGAFSSEDSTDRNADYAKDKIDAGRDQIKGTADFTKEKTDEVAYAGKSAIDTHKDKFKDSHDVSYKEDKTWNYSDRSTGDKIKDAAYDTKEKIKDLGRSMQSDKGNEAYLDTAKPNDTTKMNATDSNWSDNMKVRANNLMEKTKDAAQAIPERAKIMGHKVMDKAKNLTQSNKDTTLDRDSTLPTSDPTLNAPTTNVSDASGLTSESNKYKAADATFKAADKSQDWISDTKQKFNQEVDKAQNLASDVKHKAQENKGPSATSSVYHDSSIRGDTY